MLRIKYRNARIDLMARMMRAKAEGEGKQGMLYVGDVIVKFQSSWRMPSDMVGQPLLAV